MKGVVFTEFLEMVEARFGADRVDDILDDAQPASGGAYTAVGTYPHGEIVALVQALAVRTETPVPALLRAFGEHLFSRFVQAYPRFFVGMTDALVFLAGIEDVIHAEVLKLYPDAELPRFHVVLHEPQRLVLDYESSRHFEDLAEGLMRGCVAHFGGGIQVHREAVAPAHRVRFVLERS
ncbi:heme NO-binding domain-containing protein [Inhella gelatinilytica]|uniref:Heme NO-binding domain-containing protein n=1 Tax=Inhella gelatinilytica TaxID=2795030 RepID=A0A931IWJ8_9BURK|nr:heme NO-binding domain-containing protein [Inhella gelatinilytica]MBH9552330.1 heme NO-binding domain-containing protein [Inhella gelatinilytica]